MRPRIYGGAARMPGGSLRAGSKRPKKGLHLGSVSAGVISLQSKILQPLTFSGQIEVTRDTNLLFYRSRKIVMVSLATLWQRHGNPSPGSMS